MTNDDSIVLRETGRGVDSMSKLDPDTSSVQSPEDLSRFLLALAERTDAGTFPNENESSVDYVRAAGYWVRSMKGFFLNRGEEIPEYPSWEMIAMIFSAAFIYE
ncbi:DUF7660 family protein [Streptomyces halobius]|uniref:DUF7660 domain-containing protein n=1 Tax=Streptomyces halobius TaxID=2879846 RepID=A0ABY4MIA8_9ACTN|nr:hypothetical protein [Streptomyces halobius]UQA97087.1 hypothetical protein K9S39_39130 [Streptomyces halobius]